MAVQLLERLLLGGRSHPGDLLDVGGQRPARSGLDHLESPLLAFGAKGALDVLLASASPRSLSV